MPRQIAVPGSFGPSGQFNEDYDPVTGQLIATFAPLETTTPETPWGCRFTNISQRDIKCFARVFFTARRKLKVTRIPLDRLTAVFQGALRGTLRRLAGAVDQTNFSRRRSERLTPTPFESFMSVLSELAS